MQFVLAFLIIMQYEISTGLIIALDSSSLIIESDNVGKNLNIVSHRRRYVARKNITTFSFRT